MNVFILTSRKLFHIDDIYSKYVITVVVRTIFALHKFSFTLKFFSIMKSHLP